MFLGKTSMRVRVRTCMLSGGVPLHVVRTRQGQGQGP